MIPIRIMADELNPEVAIVTKTDRRIARLTLKEWETVFADFCLGTPFPELARKYGISENTIRNRANIKDWNGARSRSFYAGENETEERRAIDQSMADMADEFRRVAGKDALRVLKEMSRRTVEGKPPAEIYMREKILELCQKRAWQSLGLDQAKSATVVNIQVMASLSKLPAWRMRNGVTIDEAKRIGDGKHAFGANEGERGAGGRAPQPGAFQVSDIQQDSGPKLTAKQRASAAIAIASIDPSVAPVDATANLD